MTTPGVADQGHGRHGAIDQKADVNYNPTLVLCLGDGTLVLRPSAVDSGVTWMEQSYLLQQAEEHCDLAALQRPASIDYVPTVFLANPFYGHCGAAALRMIANVPDLYGEVLAYMGTHGDRMECEGCHRAGNVKRNQNLHQGRLTGHVDNPKASLHADVAGPI